MYLIKIKLKLNLIYINNTKFLVKLKYLIKKLNLKKNKL